MRLTCIISSLGSGGAERVLTTLANAWAEAGAEVTILTFDNGCAAPFFPLSAEVGHQDLDLLSDSIHLVTALAANARRVRVLRRAIRRTAPDVVISFMDATNVLTLIATRGLGVPVIVSERINTALYSSGRTWDYFRRVTYPWAARIVVQTEAALRQLPSRLRRAAVVIANPVATPSPGARSAGEGEKKVLAMGRLADQKGFDLLLRAFAQVASRHPDWSLEIWGEGLERARLETLRASLQLNGRARLPGLVSDPLDTMRSADLFVLSSRFEGFPNVLCEAMALGLPVVSFDCPHGPGEIIRDGVDGVLVAPARPEGPGSPGDIATLAAAMDRLMADAAERHRLAARAPEVLERFGIASVMRKWEAVFRDLHTYGR